MVAGAPTCRNPAFSTPIKPDDVPTYVEYGAADLGIVGRDVLLEREYDLYAPVDLGIGVCRMVVAGTPEKRATREPLRVATKYPNIATRHFLSRGMSGETIYVHGSVECATHTGLADGIGAPVETTARLWRRTPLVGQRGAASSGGRQWL